MEKAPEIIKLINLREILVSKNLIYYFLQVCTERKDLATNRWVLALMVSKGMDSNAMLGDHTLFACLLHVGACKKQTKYS